MEIILLKGQVILFSTLSVASLWDLNWSVHVTSSVVNLPFISKMIVMKMIGIMVIKVMVVVLVVIKY